MVQWCPSCPTYNFYTCTWPLGCHFVYIMTDTFYGLCTTRILIWWQLVTKFHFYFGVWSSSGSCMAFNILHACASILYDWITVFDHLTLTLTSHQQFCPPCSCKSGGHLNSFVCLSISHKTLTWTIYWSIDDRAFIFGTHMIPCDKTFPMVKCFELDLWPTSISSIVKFSVFAH